MRYAQVVQVRNVARLLLGGLAFGGAPAPKGGAAVSVTLSEWKVELSARTIGAGTVTFTVANVGTIPHALEVEGQGIEQETAVIQPGASATLTLTLKPGSYEVYCPVGNDSHKKLGMMTHLRVAASGATVDERESYAPAQPLQPVRAIRVIRVSGGGPLLHILPGPFPFPHHAAPTPHHLGDEEQGPEAHAQERPDPTRAAPPPPPP